MAAPKQLAQQTQVRTLGAGLDQSNPYNKKCREENIFNSKLYPFAKSLKALRVMAAPKPLAQQTQDRTLGAGLDQSNSYKKECKKQKYVD